MVKCLGIMFMATVLIIAPGYGSAQQPKDTPPAAPTQGQEVQKEAVGTAKTFSPEEMKAYEKKTAEELDVIQQKIGQLRVRANTGPVQQKRTLMQTANNFQFQKLAASNRLTALEKAPETAWGQQKAELDRAMVDLRQEIAKYVK